jgi:ribonuclease T1
MAVVASLLSRISRFAATGLVALAFCGGAQAQFLSGGDTIALNQLPAQGQRTYQAILNGGPFRHYGKDGAVFGNYERQLPRERRGYYLEYTVETPGARNRGARRIVCGGPATQPQACWYTADHYASFKKIVP